MDRSLRRVPLVVTLYTLQGNSPYPHPSPSRSVYASTGSDKLRSFRRLTYCTGAGREAACDASTDVISPSMEQFSVSSI